MLGFTYLAILAGELIPKGTLNDVLGLITMVGVIIIISVILYAIWPVLKQKLSGTLIVNSEPEGVVSGTMLSSFKMDG